MSERFVAEQDRHQGHTGYGDGICECGCRRPTKMMRRNETARGRVKGKHFRFVSGHHGRLPCAPYRLDNSTGALLVPLHSSKHQGMHALIDKDDAARVRKHRWRPSSSRRSGGGVYAETAIYVEGKRQTVSMHRLIMGADSPGLVDHKDGNSLNNRRSNLRWCNESKNKANSRKQIPPSSSRFKGVSWSQGKWCAYITANRKRHCLGRFDDEVAAAQAYNRAALRLFGDFARLNVLDVSAQHQRARG